MTTNKALDRLSVVWEAIEMPDAEKIVYSMKATVYNPITKKVAMYNFFGETKGELWYELLNKLGYHLEEHFTSNFVEDEEEEED